MMTRPSATVRAIAIAAVVFVVAVVALAIPLFFATMILAGPHSDLLPSFLRPIAALAAWVALVALPAWIATRVYRSRIGRHE